MSYPQTRQGHLQRLADTKPTQVELETAARVLRWLSDHVHLFPDAYHKDAHKDLAHVLIICLTCNQEIPTSNDNPQVQCDLTRQ